MESATGLALMYGLASAISWGAGDFNGGLATRRGSVLAVVLWSHWVGVLPLIVGAIALAEQFPNWWVMGMGAIAGLSGAAGVIALYNGLARGKMGVVAPLTAVVTAAIPVLAGIWLDGLPGVWQIAGFGLALIAVWFLARGEGKLVNHNGDLLLAVIAGVGFGIFFILVDQVSNYAVLWPLAAARIASISGVTVVSLFTGGKIYLHRSLWVFVVLAGLFDAGGNIMFALATQIGRLDIASVVSSLYPAITVFLAWLVLKERLGKQQWVGVAAALVALVFISR